MLASATGRDEGTIRDAVTLLCGTLAPTVESRAPVPTAVSVVLDTHGTPQTKNAVWKFCYEHPNGAVLSQSVTKNNPDTKRIGRTTEIPKTCGDYRAGNLWYLPDYDVSFTRNKDGSLKFPEGYVTVKQSSTSKE